MFNFEKDFIKELSILLAKDFSREDWLAKIGKVYTGIMSGDNIGILSQGSFKDAVIASCNPNWGEADDMASQKWDLNTFGVYKSFCYDNLLPELKRAQKLYDLTSNEAAMKWISDYVEKAFVESVVAKAFFASKEAGDYTTAGFDGINGLFTLAQNFVAGGQADANQITPITTNTKAALKAGTTAVDIIETLIDDAPADVKGDENAVIIMNQTMYDAMAYNLKINKGIYIESQWSALFNGLKETTYNGYKLVVIPTLDKIMGQMVSGDKFYGKAGIAMFTTTDNILFGTTSDDEAGVANVDVFEDKTSQDTKAVVKYSLGAAIADPKMFQLAI